MYYEATVRLRTNLDKNRHRTDKEEQEQEEGTGTETGTETGTGTGKNWQRKSYVCIFISRYYLILIHKNRQNSGKN